MGYIMEEVIAAAFTGPKVQTVLVFFRFIHRIEVLAKAQYDDFSNFKLQVHSR
jgi:hypothetical protein